MELTQEQIDAEIELGHKIHEADRLKEELKNTDYVALKISETIASCLRSQNWAELDALQEKYSLVLQERRVKRERIDYLQNEINNLIHK